jgi:hypothetical protein
MMTLEKERWLSSQIQKIIVIEFEHRNCAKAILKQELKDSKSYSEYRKKPFKVNYFFLEYLQDN